MRRSIHAAMFAAALVLPLVTATTAGATAIDAVTAPTTINGGSGCAGFTCGWEFTPTMDITVSALGQYDQNGDGLTTTADVGLWTSTGTLLASTTVPSGSAATLSNGVRYVAIGPVTLLAGVDYVVGSAYDSSDITYNALPSDFAAAITPVGGLFNAGGTLTFPSTSDDRLFVGPSFEFDAAASQVPEPTSMVLLGSGLIAAGARRWRARRQRT